MECPAPSGKTKPGVGAQVAQLDVGQPIHMGMPLMLSALSKLGVARNRAARLPCLVGFLSMEMPASSCPAE